MELHSGVTAAGPASAFSQGTCFYCHVKIILQGHMHDDFQHCGAEASNLDLGKF